LKRFTYDGVEWTVVHTGLSHAAEGVYRLDVWFSAQGRPPILGRIPKTLDAMTEDELRTELRLLLFKSLGPQGS
jgi:hypothetical protein